MSEREETVRRAERTLVNYSRAQSGGASEGEIRSLARVLAADLQAVITVLSVPVEEDSR